LQQEITRHTVIYGVWCMYTVLLILPESFATGFSAGFGQKFEFTNFHAHTHTHTHTHKHTHTHTHMIYVYTGMVFCSKK
jgi:hypothetical protein